MRGIPKLLALGCAIWLVAGCASSGGKTSTEKSFADWANSPSCPRELAIASTKAEGKLLADEFHEHVLVYSTPAGASPVENGLYWGFAHTLGGVMPKSEGLVRDLSGKLKVINDTGKHWTLFVTPGASRVFCRAVEAMPDGGLSNANGTMYLLNWQKSPALEEAVQRVSKGKFEVSYKQAQPSGQRL